MQVYRCKICGDPYLGEEKPTNCPFCGAPAEYMIFAMDWRDPAIEDLSSISKQNLEIALELETENTKFYMCASEMTSNVEGKQLFRALSKIESEHASVIAKILRVKKPQVELDKLACYPSYKDNLKDAQDREERAIKEYSKFFKDAKEPRLKEIFQALAMIEKDHLTLAKERLKG
ncbi:MAG: ferritin [Thermoplasmata archaeon]|nr:MAG: ferritin [Thermoplasmata archaeon]